MKTCNFCHETKADEAFEVMKRLPDGSVSLRTKCRVCRRDEQRAAERRYRENNPDTVKATAKKYREKSKDKTAAYHAAWRDANRDKYRAMHQRWRDANRDKVQAMQVKYYSGNVAKMCAKARAREAAEINATPVWADLNAIREVYVLADCINRVSERKVHVDHIVPLRGKTVRGFHVENNLQLLFADENMRKGNRI